MQTIQGKTMMDYTPEIVRVFPHENYTVTVCYGDGTIVTYDANPKLESGVFQHLKDKSFFVNNCKIMNGTLAWDLTGKNDPADCIDIDPCYLYSLRGFQKHRNSKHIEG